MLKKSLITSIVVAVMLVGTVDICAQDNHALLVGVSRYPSLADKFQLQGPPNDVSLMRKLLTDRFQFAADDDTIRVLTESMGNTNPSMLPTRKNIEREFSRLAKVAGPGDRVVVFMAGHGGQQPERDDAETPEPDGLDQIFLPRDVAKWAGNEADGEVPNAITDNEMGEWLKAIRARGAQLWVVFDCCHSGDITRGIGEQERFVPSGAEGLSIPAGALERSKKTGRDTSTSALSGAVEIDRQEGMAILYACQRDEKAVERALPTRADKLRYGLLTYCLSAVLSKAEAPLSYQELGKRIHLEYLRLGRTSGPTPLVEGGNVRHAVLGNETIKRPLITLRRDNRTGDLRVDVGRLHGITKSSILAVFPPAGDTRTESSGNPLGHVRVDEVDIANADVSPCEYNGLRAVRASRLIGGRCEIAELDYGDMRLDVGVDANDSHGTPIPAHAHKSLQSLLAAAVAEKHSLIRQVRVPLDTAWLLRWDAGFVHLVSSNNALTEESHNGGDKALRLFKLGSLKSAEKEAEEIRKSLKKVARAQNLLQLAATSGTPPPSLGAFSVEFELEVRRLADRFDRRGKLLKPPMRAAPGDLVQFVVRNNGNVPFDLTLLYVDSRYGVTALFPDVGENNRFLPDSAKRLPWIEITDETFGREHLVAIAVSGKNEQPISFASLEQPSIEKFRGESKVDMAIHRILERGMYGEGTTRAAGRKAVTAFRIDSIPFDVSEAQK